MNAKTFSAQIEPAPASSGFRLRVEGCGPRTDIMRSASYELPHLDQPTCQALFGKLARDFGLREPHGVVPTAVAPSDPRLRPLLTRNLSPDILYGYGDPAVLRVKEDGGAAYYLVVTSNDAPDAFPLLVSRDLLEWRHLGFCFRRGRTPAWTLTGAEAGDFWAPEMHRIGEAYWLCFTARALDGELAIGLARAPHPTGPWKPQPQPLLTGGVIDPHICVARDGRAYLFWKEDHNALWPERLCIVLRERPELIERLFASEEDRRTAMFAAALYPSLAGLGPMQRFLLVHNLIDAATADFAGFRARLAALSPEADPHLGRQIGELLDQMRTRILAQRLASGGVLEGEAQVVLENDQAWEAHVIEGVWVFEREGRYHMLYAGNDFSTATYGIGYAVSDDLLGPYAKREGPLLRSTVDWWGPGHPSTAVGPDGEMRMFLHAFRPGETGYKAFRALLAASFVLGRDGIELSPSV